MKISVVTSLYGSAAHLDELYRRLVLSLSQITADFEIVLVNDASPDASLRIALELQARPDSRLRVIDLSRNFGQHRALLTGLQYATGDLVFMMDSDLEEEPERIPVFYDLYRKASDIDLIYGIQTNRQGGAFRRWTGHLFYRLFNLLSPMPAPENPTPFRLMTRRYVDALLAFGETEVFFLGLSLLTGFNAIALPITKPNTSPSTYTIGRRLRQFIDAVTSFSDRPLIGIFYLGLAISSLSLLVTGLLVIQYFGRGIGVSGWTSLIVSIWLVGGLVIFSLGVIGIYLSRVFLEVKRRPRTIIKRIYE